VPAVIAVAAWWPVAHRSARFEAARFKTLRIETVRAEPPRRGTLPWRDGFARLAATYMAMSSVQFYGWLTWLSPYYQHLGWSAQRAALLQALWSVAQIPAALLLPWLAERGHRSGGRWVLWASVALACGVAGTVGALGWPEPPVVGPWLWVTLMAIGVGAGFPLGLSVIAWNFPDGAGAGAASGLAMGFGYLAAGLAPLLMGLLLDLTGGYPVPLTVLLVAGASQALATGLIGVHMRRRSAAPS
jgi:CP family cyanate transporter-like MFS transporter